MIPRYALPRMERIWDPEARFQCWLEIELKACEAWAGLGRIPPEALRQIRERAGFDLERIAVIEHEVRHEVIAFLTAVAERVGQASRYIHLGLTSSDVMDTALAWQMRDATDLLVEDVEGFLETLRDLARRHRRTAMVGRTHGIHAEPITFGLKVARWVAEMQRNRGRLLATREEVAVGKLSGAVGTYAHLPPAIEEYVCRALGLKAEPVSSQIIPRDRHAHFLTTLAVVGASVDNIATEIRHLQRSEVLEVEEPFAEGQKGSSAMPHKRNPVGCEQISGLSRVLRGNAVAALENVSLWHERDISHSSVERIILPDSTILLDYLLVRLGAILKTLRVYPERMERNLWQTKGLVFSEQVLLALAQKGMSREEAYRLVQKHAMRAWDEAKDFQQLLAGDPEVRTHLGAEELAACFDLGPHLAHVDAIFARLGL